MYTPIPYFPTRDAPAHVHHNRSILVTLTRIWTLATPALCTYKHSFENKMKNRKWWTKQSIGDKAFSLRNIKASIINFENRRNSLCLLQIQNRPFIGRVIVVILMMGRHATKSLRKVSGLTLLEISIFANTLFTLGKLGVNAGRVRKSIEFDSIHLSTPITRQTYCNTLKFHHEQIRT